MSTPNRDPRTRAMTVLAGVVTGVAVLYGSKLIEAPSTVPSAELGQTGTLLVGALVYIVAIILGIGAVYLLLRR